MTFGFRIFEADGVTVKVDSDTLGILFIDDFQLDSGSVTKTYPGLAGAVVTVMVDGATSMGPGATVTQAVSGSNLNVTVAVARSGRFRIMLE